MAIARFWAERVSSVPKDLVEALLAPQSGDGEKLERVFAACIRNFGLRRFLLATFPAWEAGITAALPDGAPAAPGGEDEWARWSEQLPKLGVWKAPPKKGELPVIVKADAADGKVPELGQWYKEEVD